jgi:hypothetical protein
VWLIESRIALLQRWKGLEAQKEYTRSITQVARSRLAGVTAYWASQRNEENTVFTRFKTRLEKSISTWKVAESIKDAYSFILGVTSLDHLRDVRASSVVGALASVSLIDAYAVLVAALQMLAARPHREEDFETLRAIVARLPAEDFRVSKLLALLTFNLSSLTLCETVLADRLFYPSDAPVTLPKGIIIDASLLIDRALLSAAGITAPSPPWPSGAPADDYQELVDAAVHRGPGFARRIDQASKILANLRHFAISSAASGLLWAQEPEHPISVQSTGTLLYLNTPTLHPLHAQVLPRPFGRLLCNEFPKSGIAQITADAGDGRMIHYEPLPIVGREIVARMRLADRAPDSALDYLDIDTSQEMCELSAVSTHETGRVG